MANATKSIRLWRMFVTALAAGVLLSIFGLTAQAQAAAVPAALQQDDGGGNGGDTNELYGVIQVKPESGLVGSWTISDTVYTTTDQTEYDETDGLLDVGVCARVELADDNSTVKELDSEPMDSCTPDNGGDDGGDDDGDDDGGNGGNGGEFYGWVEAMPENSMIGQWTISGSVYTVTEQTEFNDRYGRIVVGRCVEVQLTEDESAVSELGSERGVKCNRGNGGGDDDNGDNAGEGELFAKIVSLPPTPDLIGEWVIGNITVTVDANTELKQEAGEFKVDQFVKVEFAILQDGTFLAREIKTVATTAGDDDEDENDDNGNNGGDDDISRDGKAFGLIEFVPDGNTGIWQIGGISYTVTISTELDDERGTLNVGQNVKVEYTLDEQGNRTATEIKSMPRGAGNPQDLRKLVGYVQEMPVNGFVGNWMIGGVSFKANANSEFEEENGLLAQDAYVEVTYVMLGEVRMIVKLETQVVPGGGDDDQVGEVENMDDMAAAAMTAGTWVIGGRTYVVTDATVVGSKVAVGTTAVVNSYAAADGTQVATRINSITLDNRIYMPMAVK